MTMPMPLKRINPDDWLKALKERLLIENAWIPSDWGISDWNRGSNELPLSCIQTSATAAYCLKKAGFSIQGRVG